MKKILLTALAVACISGIAGAESVTLNVNDAADIQGTDVAEVPKGEGSTTGVARHIQPLQSLAIGGYTFSFAKGDSGNDPAYYYAMSTSSNQNKTIRVYGPASDKTEGNKMTIKAPEGKDFKSITFTGSNGNASKSPVASVGTAAAKSANEIEWSSDEAVSEVTFTFTNNYRINSMVISSDAVEEVPVVEAANVKAVLAAASEQIVKINFPMTVAFVSNNNVFACDEAGDFIQLYGKNNYKVNDIIPAGYEAKYELYKDVTPELLPVDPFPESTAQGKFVPKVVAAADINNDLVNNVIVIKQVTFAEATPAEKANFTGKSDDVELSFRNNYALPSVEAGTYDVEVLVTVYNNVPSIYIISYEAESGVAAIEADVNAAPVYYNLQGVRVENPAKGLYIVVKGGKSSKVMF